MSTTFNDSVVSRHLRRAIQRSAPVRPPRAASATAAATASASAGVIDAAAKRPRTENNADDDADGISPKRFYTSPAAVLDATPVDLRTYARQWLSVLKAIETPGRPLPATFNARPVRYVWRVFAKQRDAFAYLDAQYEELHAFAFEDASTASHDGSSSSTGSGRKYLVTSYESFWLAYKRMPSNERHFYELIRDNTPCRLYFDIEFLHAENPGADGPAMMVTFKRLVAQGLQRLLNVECEAMIDLDSSTPVKFSRHLIVHLKDAVFCNNVHAGVFVLNLLHTWASEDNMDARQCMVTSATHQHRRYFVDDAVYTRNRTFRLFRSSKYGKNREFTLSSNAGEHSGYPVNSLAFFKSTLVCSTGATIDATKIRMIQCDLLPSTQIRAHAVGITSGLRADSGSPAEPSPYPAIDMFILDFVAARRPPGASRPFLRSTVMFREGGKGIIYHIGGDRFCENIGRQHKSNHVFFVVDLHHGVFVQRCTDPECRVQNYQSQPRPLPVHLNPFAHSHNRRATNLDDTSDDDDPILDDSTLVAAAEAVDPSLDADQLDFIDDATLASLDMPSQPL